MNNIIFAIEGGLGKSIMATAVLKAIKAQYKKANILVSTAYPDVFINNPNVNKIITSANNSGIYRDYVQNKDAKVFISDPYSTSDYITESKHLIEIWCDMFGIKYNGEMPELFLSKAEKQYFEPFYRLDKPIKAEPSETTIPATAIPAIFNHLKVYNFYTLHKSLQGKYLLILQYLLCYLGLEKHLQKPYPLKQQKPF